MKSLGALLIPLLVVVCLLAISVPARSADATISLTTASQVQKSLLECGNATSRRYGVIRSESASLMAAAQDHADFLARSGYGAYLDRFGRIVKQPNAHTGFGNGDAYSRAAKHGFTGSLTTDDPRCNIPGHGVTGDIILTGPLTIEQAFAEWEKRDTGHWIPLTSHEFDVAGFGHAINPSGESIYVGMFGNSRRGAARPEDMSCGPGACNAAEPAKLEGLPQKALSKLRHPFNGNGVPVLRCLRCN